MCSWTCRVALLTLQLAICVCAHASRHTYTIPPTVQPGASCMQTRSNQGPFDGPKLDFINATSFDFWYFDVAGHDGTASIVLAFYTASSYALGASPTPPTPTDNINFITVYGSFPNGTLFYTQVEAGDAIVTTEGDGSSGNWTGTGVGWVGTSDLSSWAVTIDMPQFKGKILMKSRSPAHYWDAPVSVHQDLSEELQPNIGWANSVPDAHARVEANIEGSPLTFTGSGYHDKNWGNRPLNTIAKSWIWGHASVGPFSLVFWRIVSNAGVQVNNLYLTRHRKVLACGASTLKLISTDSFSLSIDAAHYGRFLFVGNTSISILNLPGLNRWVGTMSGGLVGEEEERPGTVLWEHFILS